MRMIVQFERHDCVRFISQLDMLRTIHRALRRADIPVAYSEGFNPQPRVSFGFALSVGLVSYGEYMDIHLKSEITADEFVSRMNKVMPQGMKIASAAVANERTPKIGKMIDCAKFSTRLIADDNERLLGDVKHFFERDSIIIERHTKKGASMADVGAYIYYYDVNINDKGEVVLTTVQALSEEMSVRMDDLVSALKAFCGYDIKSNVIKLDTLLRQGESFISPVELTRLS